jgi:hypothetical protein
VHVHNGQTTRFWTSDWLNGTLPTSLFPVLYNHSKRKNRTVAEAMTNQNWIRDIMHGVTTYLLTQYVLLWELVEVVGFNHHDQEADEIIWTRTSDAKYLAKSSYIACSLKVAWSPPS